MAIYTIFLIKQFPSNGHLFFSLQLHDVSVLFSMLLSVIFLLWFLIICSVSSATMAYFDAVSVENFV